LKTNLLKAERVKKGLTQKMISETLEIDVTSYSKKENGIIEFKASEIKAIKNILNLTPNTVAEIFFDEKLEFNSSLCN
jgi:transcriptional regulator with XRE-family HTH domain